MFSYAAWEHGAVWAASPPAVEGGRLKFFDACGYDYIIIETVESGNPRWTSLKWLIQPSLSQFPVWAMIFKMIKAGILEIGDVLVINKSDLDGASHLASMLQTMLYLSDSRGEKFMDTTGFDGDRRTKFGHW